MSNAATIIEEYLKLREIKKERKAAYDADLLRFDNALEAREAELLRIMTERGEKNIVTDAGTAFKSPQVRVGVEDREAFLAFMLENETFDYITNAVAKEPVKAYVEAHGAPPPGVKFEQFIQVNVRKA